MGRPHYSQEQIIDLLREAELRLAQGEPLASVCKSLGISRLSYRWWRTKYGERATDNEAAVASGSTGQTAPNPASTEDVLARGAKASPNGEVPALSGAAKELLDAANDASGPARNVWLAFLFLLAYLLVTLGGVSHKDLLLNSPIRLPIVNVDIPLFSFFQYAPLALLLVYLSLLIQHVILARKYRTFTANIAPYENEAQTEHAYRELVHPYIVSQLLAGPKQNLGISWLMRLMVFVTFALLPVVTLLYFQVNFLPYHDVWITYWHRIAVLLGLTMFLFILPIIRLKAQKREVKLGRQAEAWRASPLGILTGFVFAAVVLGFSWLIATIPAEGLDRLMGFVPPHYPSYSSSTELLNPLVRAAYRRMAEDHGWLLPWLVSPSPR